ncbi:MAG: rhodanese-like domain-containing protein [Myxococcota bacterium]|jgi:rhodanese-related sulfurtransferase|nr:rhodanese-like domain-containing protein [Myxococcota bacterium]
MLGTSLRVLRDAALASVLLSALGLTVNALREDGIPVFADKPYEIFVPCPEPLGRVDPMEPGDPLVFDGRTVLIDARTEAEFEEWHADGARLVTYDYLDPIPESQLESLSHEIANTGAARVVVYGDGDGERGSTGYELGRELSGRGLNNVYVIKGGATALREVGQ